jgi:hypothetical protein
LKSGQFLLDIDGKDTEQIITNYSFLKKIYYKKNPKKKNQKFKTKQMNKDGARWNTICIKFIKIMIAL